jgi:hypothetical protein
MKCVFFCCVVVVAIYMATIRVYLHDVSLMLVRVEGAYGGEGGAPGQHTWHTQCPFLMNRNTSTSVAVSATSTLHSVSKSASLTTESASPFSNTMTTSNVSTSPSTADVANTPAAPVSQGAPSKSKTGAIAGGVVGGLIGLVLMGGLVLFLLKRRQRGDKSGEIQSVRKEDEKVGTVDGKFVPHETNRPADTELSEWVGRSA